LQRIELRWNTAFCSWKSWIDVLKANNFFQRRQFQSSDSGLILWGSTARKLCTCQSGSIFHVTVTNACVWQVQNLSLSHSTSKLKSYKISSPVSIEPISRIFGTTIVSSISQLNVQRDYLLAHPKSSSSLLSPLALAKFVFGVFDLCSAPWYISFLFVRHIAFKNYRAGAGTLWCAKAVRRKCWTNIAPRWTNTSIVNVNEYKPLNVNEHIP